MSDKCHVPMTPPPPGPDMWDRVTALPASSGGSGLHAASHPDTAQDRSPASGAVPNLGSPIVWGMPNAWAMAVKTWAWVWAPV